MPNRAVSIYELVKHNATRSWRAVEIPTRQKPLRAGLYLKDDRQGDFYISWYSNERDSKKRPKKRFKKVKGGRLGLAITAAEGKRWELLHPERVKEEVPDDEQLTVGGGVHRYLEQMASDDYTRKEHRHALEQYQGWSGNTFVDEMTRDELLQDLLRECPGSA